MKAPNLNPQESYSDDDWRRGALELDDEEKRELIAEFESMVKWVKSTMVENTMPGFPEPEDIDQTSEQRGAMSRSCRSSVVRVSRAIHWRN